MADYTHYRHGIVQKVYTNTGETVDMADEILVVKRNGHQVWVKKDDLVALRTNHTNPLVLMKETMWEQMDVLKAILTELQELNRKLDGR